jgi:hypothetical protein
MSNKFDELVELTTQLKMNCKGKLDNLELEELQIVNDCLEKLATVYVNLKNLGFEIETKIKEQVDIVTFENLRKRAEAIRCNLRMEENCFVLRNVCGYTWRELTLEGIDYLIRSAEGQKSVSR